MNHTCNRGQLREKQTDRQTEGQKDRQKDRKTETDRHRRWREREFELENFILQGM